MLNSRIKVYWKNGCAVINPYRNFVDWGSTEIKVLHWFWITSSLFSLVIILITMNFDHVTPGWKNPAVCTPYYRERTRTGYGARIGIMPKLEPLKWSTWGSVTRPCLLPVTGNGHDYVPSPTWYMIKVIRANADGPMRIGVTNENRGDKKYQTTYSHWY